MPSKWLRRKMRGVYAVAPPPLEPRLHMRALEPRIVLDAAAVETAADGASSAIHADLAMQVQSQERNDSDNLKALPELGIRGLEIEDLAGSAFDIEREPNVIAFISADVPDIQVLVSELPGDVEVIVLDENGSGLEQIAQVLSERNSVDAIHIVSHGDDGILRLGDATLTSDSMQTEYASQLAEIGAALGEQGDILIYGCNFAAGEAGRLAVNTMAYLTGADVAASVDVTGHSGLGGDWELEVEAGEVEAETFDLGDAWEGTLDEVILEEHDVPFVGISDHEPIGSDRIIGQTFSHDSGNGSYEVDQIDLVLREQAGASQQTITVTIRNSYNGTPIASGSISSASLDTGYDWYSLVLDAPVTLNDGDEYFIMVETDSTEQSIELGVEKNDDYPNGEYIKEDGKGRGNHDALFRIIDITNSDPVITSNGGNYHTTADVDENETFVTTVIATDPDVPANTLTYSISGGISGFLFTIDPVTGDLYFNDVPDYENPIGPYNDEFHQVEVRVDDGFGGSDRQMIMVEVHDVNDAPVATGGAVMTDEDTPGTFLATHFGFHDDDGDSLQSVTLTNFSLAGGTLTFASTGTAVSEGDTILAADIPDLLFSPAQDSSDTATFDYTVNDADNGVVSAQMSIAVDPVNDAPTGTGAAVVTDEDTPVNGTISMNDVDDGDTPEASLGTPPASGTAIVNLDGTFTYTPNPDFQGSDAFTVIITDDDGETATVTVNVTVNPVNDAPTGTGTSVTTDEDTAVNGAITMGDIDSGDTPEASIGILPANGTVTINPDGTFAYVPAADFNGSDSFTVVITDDAGATTSVTVNVTIDPVNDAPTGTATSVTTDEDTPISSAITMGDVDAGDTPEASLGTPPANGSATVNPDGTYTYTPATNFNGTDSFTVIVTDDSGETDIVTVNITVDPVNDAPTGSGTSVTTDEDTPVNGSIAMNDVDVGDTPEASLGTPPANGNVTVNPDGTFTYNPAADFNGIDGFTIIITDDAGATVTVAVDVTVNPVNDAPTGTGASVVTDEETTVNGAITMGDVDVGDTPEATLRTPPTNGTATVNLDGTYSYTPAANFVGNDSFTILITDDAGLTEIVTVNVTVDPVNDAPTGTGASVTTDEDMPVSGAITMFDTDAGDTPEASLGTPPVNGTATVNPDGTFLYSPALNFNGMDSFTITITDDAGETATVTVNVTVDPVNDAPTGSGATITTDEDTAVNGAVSMTDVDVGDTPEASLGTPPANGSAIVNPDGTFTYSPSTHFEGNDSFTVIITDDAGETATVTVNVTVNPVNDAPVGIGTSVTTDEDVSANGAITMADIDAGDTPEASLGTPPASGTASVNPDGTFTYTPAANFNGNDSFTVIITDDAGETATVTVNVTVDPVNDAPFGADLSVTTDEDTAVSGAVAMADVDVGDTPEASLGTPPANGNASVNPDGTFSYNPLPNFNGNDSFTIIITDDAGATDSVTVSITINPVNDAPTGLGTSITIDEDTAASGSISMGDVDAGDTLEASLGSSPANGNAVVNPDGTFVYTPFANFNGSDTFTVIITDGAGETATVTVNITVDPVNDAPTGTGSSVTTDEDVPVNGSISMADVDVGDTPEASLGLPPSNGLATVNADGTFSYTPASNFSGSDSFTIIITDDAGATEIVTVNITVDQTNTVPVAIGRDIAAAPNQDIAFSPSSFRFQDADGDALQSVRLFNLDLQGGTLTINGGAVTVTDGMVLTRSQISSLVFSPAANSLETVKFAYTVNDSAVGAVSALITIEFEEEDVTAAGAAPAVEDNGVIESAEGGIEAEITEVEPLETIEVERITMAVPAPSAVESETLTPPPILPEKVAPPAPVASQAEPAQPVQIASLNLQGIVPQLQHQEKTVEQERLDKPEPVKTVPSVIGFEPVRKQTFEQELERVGDEVRESGALLGVSASKVTFTFGSLLSVGGVSFALRGGLLAAALMSALPAWSRFDPISIVSGKSDEDEEEEQSEADRMQEFIHEAQSRVKKDSFL